MDVLGVHVSNGYSDTREELIVGILKSRTRLLFCLFRRDQSLTECLLCCIRFPLIKEKCFTTGFSMHNGINYSNFIFEDLTKL